MYYDLASAFGPWMKQGRRVEKEIKATQGFLMQTSKRKRIVFQV
jgi:hypothetical protein